jgi:uncharacterized membrane protein
MDHTLDRLSSTDVGAPRVRLVATSQPLNWLRRGYADLSALRRISLAYGALVAVFGLGLLAVAWGASYLVPALLGGFLLVAPFAAIVLYALSRQRAQRLPVDAVEACFAWRRNASSIGLFGLVLTLTLIAWERLAAIIFALFYGGDLPDPSHLVAEVLFSGKYLALLIAFFGAGALFAAAVFALSVVTAPLLLDRPIDVVTAMLTSLRCCARNPRALLLWAALIVVLTAIGFATFMLGLVVIFPWLGHSSWHAYRDLVDPP